MKLTYTTHAALMALISLVPVFALVPVYPAFWFVVSCNNYAHLTPFQATWIFVALCLILLIAAIVAFAGYARIRITKGKPVLKVAFTLFGMVSYALIDVLIFIPCTGIPLYGGESMFSLFFSGPAATLSLILFGLLTDVYLWHRAQSRPALQHTNNS